MLIGDKLYWINLNMDSRRFRRVYATTGNKYPNYSLDDLYIDYRIQLRQISSVIKSNFESNYRRRSENLSVNLDRSLKSRAYFDKKSNSRPVITMGLLMAVDDACQSIVSDYKSLFAYSYEEMINHKYGVFPLIRYIQNDEEFFDEQRYVSYERMKDFLVKVQDFYYEPFYKFLSESDHRQVMGDLLAMYSTAWIVGHEDAHNYLGHSDYYENLRLDGFSINDSSEFFQEFLRSKENSIDNKIRLSAELMADHNSSILLCDLMGSKNIFRAYPFLKEHLKITLDYKDEEPKEGFLEFTMTSYIIRLCIICQVIPLAIFYRNTVKNNSPNTNYPELGYRILNCISSTSSRFQNFSANYEWRGIYRMPVFLWEAVMTMVADDIAIILKYVFEVGVVLKDRKVEKKKIADYLEVDLSAESLIDLITYFNMMGVIKSNEKSETPASIVTWNDLIALLKKHHVIRHEFVVRRNQEIIEYLKVHNELRELGAKTFRSFRETASGQVKWKSTESYFFVEDSVNLYKEFIEIYENNAANNA